MAYALVRDGVVVSFDLPSSARRIDTGAWVLGLPDASDALKAACGYLPVVDVARPADTATETFDRTVEVVAGKPTVVWAKRLKTADELNPPKTADEKLTEARTVLEQIASLPAPVLTADVVDLLDDLRGVL